MRKRRKGEILRSGDQVGFFIYLFNLLKLFNLILLVPFFLGEKMTERIER